MCIRRKNRARKHFGVNVQLRFYERHVDFAHDFVLVSSRPNLITHLLKAVNKEDIFHENF